MGTKLGLLGVTVLLAGFGYVLYRKAEQNKALGSGLLAAGEEPSATHVTPEPSSPAPAALTPPPSQDKSAISFDQPMFPQPIQQASHEVPAVETNVGASDVGTATEPQTTVVEPQATTVAVSPGGNAEPAPVPDSPAENPLNFEPAVPVDTPNADWTGVKVTASEPLPETSADIEVTAPAPTESAPFTAENPFGAVEISDATATMPAEEVNAAPAATPPDLGPTTESAAPETSELPKEDDTAAVNSPVATTPPVATEPPAAPFDFAPAPTGDAAPEMATDDVVTVPVPVPDPAAESQETPAMVFSEPPAEVVETAADVPASPAPEESNPAAVPDFAASESVAEVATETPSVPFEPAAETVPENTVAVNEPAASAPPSEPAVFEAESPFGSSEPMASPVASESTPSDIKTTAAETATAPDPFSQNDPFAGDPSTPPAAINAEVESPMGVPLQPGEPDLQPVPTAVTEPMVIEEAVVVDEPATAPVPFTETPSTDEPVPFAKSVPFDQTKPGMEAVPSPTDYGTEAAPNERATAELFGPVDPPAGNETALPVAPAPIDVPAPASDPIQQTAGDTGEPKDAFKTENPFTNEPSTEPVDKFAIDTPGPAAGNADGTPAVQMSNDYEPELVPVPTASSSDKFEPDAPAFKADEIDVYEVRPRDNYWSISKRVYGTGRYFTALARFNRERIPDPKKMRPGMKVMVPTREALEQANPDLFPKRVLNTDPAGADSGFFMDENGTPRFRVGKEDTLGSIAHAHLGRFSRWTEIYQLNRQRLIDPNKLTVGTELQLPQDASRVRVVSAEVIGR